MIFRKLKGAFNAGLFLYRNMSRAAKMKKSPIISEGGITYRGVIKNELAEAEFLYRFFHEGKGFSWDKKIIYRMFSEQMIIVAVNEENYSQKFVGINVYYFNRRDILEGTVHEGFIGVLPEAGGRGIATNLGLHAKKHFADNGFKGLSSRVSLNNEASLISRKKIGYEPVEAYFDSVMNEDRYYMICELGNACD